MNFWVSVYHLPSVVQYIVHSLAPSLVAVSAIILLSVCTALMSRGRSRSGHEARHVTDDPLSFTPFPFACSYAVSLPFLTLLVSPLSPPSRTRSLCRSGGCLLTTKPFGRQQLGERVSVVRKRTSKYAPVRISTHCDAPTALADDISKTMRRAPRVAFVEELRRLLERNYSCR